MANSLVTISLGKNNSFGNGKNHAYGGSMASSWKACDLLHVEEQKDTKDKEKFKDDCINSSKVKDDVLIKDAKIKAKEETLAWESTESPYPEIPGLPHTYHTFHLGHGGWPPCKREQALAATKKFYAAQQANFLGYQINYRMEYARDFAGFLDTSLNNVGDAFKEGNFTLNSKFMERAVLDYYAQLWNAKWPHCDSDPESYWGFCLSMGSTEGNLYGMWNGRDYLSGMRLLVDDRLERRCGGALAKVPRLVYQKSIVPAESKNAYTPIAFYSEDTHYSLAKAMTMLDIITFDAEGEDKYPGECPITDDGTWPAEVPSHDSGAINVDSLAILVEFFASRGYPILVCFNYGTTFKGAYDDIGYACFKLKPILAKYGLLEREVKYDDKVGKSKVGIRTGYWFHVDGALGAAYMPFMEMAYHAGRIPKKGPCFDFRLPMVHSIVMSGHKWIGAPVPCGVYMTRTKYQMMPPDIPEYIGTPDTTFAGSRSGLPAILLWDSIARHSYKDEIKKALEIQELAAYTESRLRHLQDEVLQTDLYVGRSPLSLTVHFKRASDDLCRKYSLSNEDWDGRRYSHLFVMEHVTRKLVDAFIEDLSQEGAFAAAADEKKRCPLQLDHVSLRAPAGHL